MQGSGVVHIWCLRAMGVMVLNSEQGWEYKLSEKGHGQDRAGKVTSGLSTLWGNSCYIATLKSPRTYLTPHHSTSLFPETMVALPPTLFPLHPSLPYTLSPVGHTLHFAPAMGFTVNPKSPQFFQIKRINKEVGVLQPSYLCVPSCDYIY